MRTRTDFSLPFSLVQMPISAWGSPSPYSANSINNPNGQYGSRYSNQSPNNPSATAALTTGGASRARKTSISASTR